MSFRTPFFQLLRIAGWKLCISQLAVTVFGLSSYIVFSNAISFSFELNNNHDLSDTVIHLSLFAFALLSYSIYLHIPSTPDMFQLANSALAPLRKKCVNAIYQNRLSFSTGEVSTTCFSSFSQLHEGLCSGLSAVFSVLVKPIVLLVVVLWIDLQSGLLLLVTLPVMPFLLWLVGSKVRQIAEAGMSSLLRLGATYSEQLRALPTLIETGNIEFSAGRLERSGEDLRKNTMKLLRVAFISSLVLEWAACGATALIAVVLGFRLLEDNSQFADALLVLLLVPEVFSPFQQVASKRHILEKAFASMKHINQIVNRQPVTSSVKTTIKEDSLDFLLTDFAYPDSQKTIIQQQTLQINKGICYALQGSSGSGKSTLLKCIATAFIQNNNPVRWLYVPQTPSLIEGTLKDNVLLYNGHGSEKDVFWALEQAGLSDLPGRLPDGVHALLSGKHQRLSGGELRRLALARLYIANPDLILLDEPAVHLDKDKQNEVDQKLFAFLSGKTSIIATHRNDLAAKADKILGIADGMIHLKEINTEDLNEPS